MADPFATHAQLAARWKTLTADEQSRADVLLGIASREIRRKFPQIDFWIDSLSIDPEIVVDVACAMVKRAMRANSGVKSSTRHIGSVELTETYDSAADDEIYLTSRELERLTPTPVGPAGVVPLYSFPVSCGYPF